MTRRVLFALFPLLTLLPVTAQVERRELLEEQIGAYEELLNVRQAELDALTDELSATNTELDAQLAERDRLAGRVVALSDEQSRIRAQTRTLEQQAAGRGSADRTFGGADSRARGAVAKPDRQPA